MKQDIILAGVGGQGILSISFVLVNSANENGFYTKQSEVHGMSQRGGPVFSFVRFSDEPVFSDLIPEGEADMIIGLEPMETLRYTRSLKDGGYILTDSTPIKVGNYDEDKIESVINDYPNHLMINAQKIAQKAGNKLAGNMVMVGAASPFLNLEMKTLKDSIKTLFGRKGEDIVNVNIKAFEEGVKLGKELKEKTGK